jgi:hypothetical protein
MENGTLMWKLRMDTDMRISSLRLAACCAILGLAAPAESQVPAPTPSYADLADLALAARITAQVRLISSIEIKGEQAAKVPRGFARFYVVADIVSLIRSAEPIPSRVNYLVELPRDARGKAPKLRKGTEYLLFAAPVKPNSLLWYRLACSLPRALPSQSLADSAPADAEAAAADYRFVLEQLGACVRMRARQTEGSQNEASSTPTPALSE